MDHRERRGRVAGWWVQPVVTSAVVLASAGVSAERAAAGQSGRQEILADDRVGSIRLERMVLLDPSAPGANPTMKVVSHQSKFFVVDPFNAAAVYVYGAAGSFLRALGREGEGPGEFQAIAALASGPGESITVVDAMNLRRIVIGPDLSIAEETPLTLVPLRADMVVLDSGDLVLNGGTQTTDATAALVHRVAAKTGEIRWSMDPSGAGRDGEARRWPYTFAKSPGGVWLLGPSDYSVWKVDSKTGDVSGYGQRKMEDWQRVDREGRPPSMAMHIKEDSQGRLWVAIRMPDPAGAFDRSEGPLTNVVFSRVFDTVVEVLDPEERRVVGSIRLDAFPAGLIGAGVEPGSMRVFSYDDEQITTAIWEARVSHNPC